MEIIRKKEIRLSTFFLRFLIATVLSGLIAFILWIALLTLAIGSDIIIPANRIEQSVQDFTSNLDSGTVVTADMIPQEADYAIYSKTGALQETNLSDELLENAGTLLASDKQTLNTNIRGRVFSKTETDQQDYYFFLLYPRHIYKPCPAASVSQRRLIRNHSVFPSSHNRSHPRYHTLCKKVFQRTSCDAGYRRPDWKAEP